jgi:hypothetical protein
MPTEETAAPVADVAPVADAAPAPEWDGADWSPETLDKQPWRKAIPDTAWSHITKAHEERTKSKERTDFLDRMFNADEDTVRRDLVAAQTERDALRTERDALKESLSGIEARTAQEQEDKEYERLSTKFSDIWADIHPDEKGDLLPKGAYVKFVKLLQAGFDEDEAASMARAVMITKAAAEPAAPAAPAGPPKTRDVKPPPSIAQASKGGANPSSTVNAKEAGEDLTTRARRLQAQYAAEEAAEG